jgi:hypothetical protein
MYATHRVVRSRMSNAKAEQPSPGAGPKICLNPLVMCLCHALAAGYPTPAQPAIPTLLQLARRKS